METTPHDALFRGIFGQPEHMAAELRAVLPPEVAAHLDLDKLLPVPATVVDEALAERHADLLFETRLRSGRPALVYVLVEHQSSHDPWMPLRLLGYLVRIWEQWQRLNPAARRLPAILPIVVHHGRSDWSVPASFLELLDLDATERRALAPHLVSFASIVDDLAGHPPAAVATRGMAAVARLALLALQSARDGDEFRRQITLLARVYLEAKSAGSAERSLALVLRYLFELRAKPDLSEVTSVDVLGGVDAMESMEKKFLSWAEEERQIGRAAGALTARRQILWQQATQRFGALSHEQGAAIEHGDEIALSRALQRILTARTFEELFAP